MKRSVSVVAAGVLALTAVPALAAGTATVRVQQGPEGGMAAMNFAWDDAERVRMSVQGQPGYMVVRDGSAYAVQKAGGQTMVMDLTAMQQGGGELESQGLAGQTELLGLEPMGESAQVAGIDGQVYRMEWRQRGERKSQRATLSEDPRARELTGAWGVVASSMGVGPEEDPDGVMRRLREDGLGLLELEGQFEVTSVSTGAPDAGVFELPAEPMDPMKMMQQRMQDQ